MRWMILLLVPLGLFVALAVGLRLYPMPAERWHVEPAEITPPDLRNFARAVGPEAPLHSGDITATAAIVQAAAAQDNARLIAGDLTQGHATYVVRTAVLGFPDAISIRLVPQDGGTRVEYYARAAIGGYDWGVNAARMARWTAPLAP